MSLAFTATADGATVGLEPFYDAHGHNYTVYWSTGGAAGRVVKRYNANSDMVLGVEDMSTADDARVLQWSDNGTADHLWTLVDAGEGTVKLRNGHSGKLLAVRGGSTAAGAQAVQAPDGGDADRRWRLV